MTIAYIDVAKAPVQVPVIDLLGEPQGAAFDFINEQAWIVDKVNPANTMLRDVGDVLVNPGASASKLLRRKSGLIESAPWWVNEYDSAGKAMGMRVEGQRTRLNTNFETLNFSSSGFTTIPNAELSPLGEIKATKLAEIEGVEGVKASVIRGQGGPDTSQYETIFAKAAERRYFTIWTVRGSVQGGFVIDLVTGETRRWYINSGSQARTPNFPRIELYPAGWVKIDMELLGMSGSDYRIGFSTEFGTGLDAPASYVGVAGAGIYVWGRNNINDPVPGSIIASFEGSQATRAADAPRINRGFFPYNRNAGTLIVDAMAYDYDSNANNPAFGFYGPGGNPQIMMNKTDGGTNNSTIESIFRTDVNYEFRYLGQNFAFPVAPAPKKLGLSWDTTSEILASGALGLAEEFPTVNWTPFDYERLEFRSAHGIMWYRSAVYIPRKLTAAELLARVRA